MRHNAKMLTQIATIGGLAGLIMSLILLAWQTRAVARQTEISNAIARASAISNSSSSFRQVILLLNTQNYDHTFTTLSICLYVALSVIV